MTKQITGDSFLTLEVLNLVNSVSTDETRYHLNGVYINLKDKEAAVTDGHQLVTCQLNDIGNFSQLEGDGFILSTECCKAFAKLIKKSEFAGNLTVDLDAGKITLQLFGQSLSFNFIEGQFPDYQKVMPKMNGSHQQYCVNPKLIEQVRKSFGLKPKDIGGLIFNFKISDNIIDHLAPCVVTCNIKEKTNLKAVIMPMRMK